MSKPDESMSWVVYQISTHEKTAGRNAVCEQSEWEEMERIRPGYHTLLRGGITSEGEAERMARGTSGDLRQSGYVKKRA